MSGNELLSSDLVSLNEALAHYGVAGMEWYKNKADRWQPQAKYARGKANPNADRSNTASDSKKTSKRTHRGVVGSSPGKALRNLDNKDEEYIEKAEAKEAKKKEKALRKMSDDELRAKTARLSLEAAYKNAERSAIDAEKNLIYAQKQLNDATRVPEKKGFFKKNFEAAVSTVSDVAISSGKDFLGKYLSAEGYKYISNKYGEDIADTIYKKGGNGGKNNDNKKGQNGHYKDNPTGDSELDSLMKEEQKLRYKQKIEELKRSDKKSKKASENEDDAKTDQNQKSGNDHQGIFSSNISDYDQKYYKKMLDDGKIFIATPDGNKKGYYVNLDDLEWSDSKKLKKYSYETYFDQEYYDRIN